MYMYVYVHICRRTCKYLRSTCLFVQCCMRTQWTGRLSHRALGYHAYHLRRALDMFQTKLPHALCYVTLYDTIFLRSQRLYCTILFHVMLHDIMLYFVLPYYVISHYVIRILLLGRFQIIHEVMDMISKFRLPRKMVDSLCKLLCKRASFTSAQCLVHLADFSLCFCLGGAIR